MYVACSPFEWIFMVSKVSLKIQTSLWEAEYALVINVLSEFCDILTWCYISIIFRP